MCVSVCVCVCVGGYMLVCVCGCKSLGKSGILYSANLHGNCFIFNFLPNHQDIEFIEISHIHVFFAISFSLALWFYSNRKEIENGS